MKYRESNPNPDVMKSPTLPKRPPWYERMDIIWRKVIAGFVTYIVISTVIALLGGGEYWYIGFVLIGIAIAIVATFCGLVFLWGWADGAFDKE